MLDVSLLKLLVCPETHQPLQMADQDLIALLNTHIANGNLSNLAGVALKQPLDGGLVREDQKILYPIIEGIPSLLNDEAIELNSNDV